MCILLNMKKHEKTFAFNVDISKNLQTSRNFLTYSALQVVEFISTSDGEADDRIRQRKGAIQL